MADKENKGKYTVYTDGGCIPNPGGSGGYGVVIIRDGKEITRKYGGYAGTTNNRMELTAAIIGLELLPDGSCVRLYSDSQYLVNTMKGMYSKKKNHDLWERLTQQCRRHKNVEFCWVRGHHGDKYNEICDSLASMGIQEASEPDIGYGGTPHSPAVKAVKDAGTGPNETIAGLTNTNIPEGYLNPSCEATILRFRREEKHSFHSYKELASGGRDGFSCFKGDTLLDAVGNTEITDFFFSVFPDKKAEAACRWYLRGLTVEEAFRKTQVDMEIEQNAVKSIQKNKGRRK